MGEDSRVDGGDISGQGGDIRNSDPELVFWKYYRLTLSAPNSSSQKYNHSECVFIVNK